MAFMEVFWATYVPLILLLLSLAVRWAVDALRRDLGSSHGPSVSEGEVGARSPEALIDPQHMICDPRRKRGAVLA